MKLVIFGLTVSSSWGNGHATLWRGLCNALGRRGHRVVFFERDVPYGAHVTFDCEKASLKICEVSLFTDERFDNRVFDGERLFVGSPSRKCFNCSINFLVKPLNLRIYP